MILFRLDIRTTALGLFFVLLCACGPSGSGVDKDGGASGDGGTPGFPDEDGDFISDVDEGRAQNVDTDGDGTADYLDDDSDGDGVPDSREAGDADASTQVPDSDGDGARDFRDTDSDDNGRTDAVDGTQDHDADRVPDFADLDDDGDELPDVVELGSDASNPVDSDGDSTPDYRDADSDGDMIRDAHELQTDGDTDGIPAYLDWDSDADCRSDRLEAGDEDLATEPIDSDGDGGGDFIDLDSDGDGLLDQLEDLNCNGVLDGGESSPRAADTDLDGTTDLVEVIAGTDPTNPADNPQANGDFVFVMPFMAPPTPAVDTLDFSSSITQADVFFLMDTTGSMGGVIANLRSSLSTITAALSVDIPDIGVGVGGYDDFPISPYGGAGDQPFYLRHRVMTVATAPGLASVQAQVNSLSTHWGNDGPESAWEGLHQVATGVGTGVGGASVAAFDPATAHPAVPPAGESTGDIGGVGFRSGSLPIVVIMTDIHNHNSESFPGDNYSFGGAAMRSSAVAEAMVLGAQVIGVTTSSANARTDMLYAANTTGAIVPPAGWGPVGVRPGSCAETSCCTGSGGAGQPTDGAGLCPLVFTMGGDGSGLGSAITRAIQVLTTYVELDIKAMPEDDPTDTLDAVQAFIERLAANPTAPAPCAAGLTAQDSDGDGVLDEFIGVLPGATVCFDVVPKVNTTVPPMIVPQTFRAHVRVMGNDVTTLDSREIFFLVPPEIPDPPIM